MVIAVEATTTQPTAHINADKEYSTQALDVVGPVVKSPLVVDVVPGVPTLLATVGVPVEIVGTSVVETEGAAVVGGPVGILVPVG